MKKAVRILSVVMAVIMVLGMAACGSKDSGASGDARQITWWIPVGDDVSFYEDYEYNPVIQWIRNTKTFNGKALDIDFVAAPPSGFSEDWSRLVASGDYCGVMSMAGATMTAAEMYGEGMTWDLTDLVPEHMPNLMAFLEKNPNLKDELYTVVDGEKKIISLCGFKDGIDAMWAGYVYRRDWIAKYGVNPTTGAAFNYGFTDPSDDMTWYDDVVFPNGTDEPIYISDWEWMFEIFTKAMEAEGIEDGYCISPFYMGYQQTGDFFTGFGGGAPYWYLKDGTIINGVTTEGMRAYLQCLNTWYNKGWMDQHFDEHTGDMFFAVDATSVFQGKVGLWFGRSSTVGTQIRTEGTASVDAVVYGCRQPINDVYGSDEVKNVTPNYMYQQSRVDQSAVLTDKLSEEEVIAVLEYVDYLFSDEGSVVGSLGLNPEQLAQSPHEFYDRCGLTETGAYTLDEEGIYHLNIPASDSRVNGMKLDRMSLKLCVIDKLDNGFDRYGKQSTDAWDYYESTANIPNPIINALSVEQNQTITKIRASLDQFQQRTVPAIIKGEAYDLYDDASWEQFCKDINKYRADQVTAIYQEVYDLYK